MSNNLLTDTLSAPLNGATAARIEIDTATGNLMIDDTPENTQVLASGELQYFEKQGRPAEFCSREGGKATVKLMATAAGVERPWFRWPWLACLGGTDWQIHLNPSVSSEITAHTGGGNVKLNLADMVLANLSADTGGGNLEVVLPEHAADLHVKARTGGGNISIEIGHAMSGINTVEASSGAGNVVVEVPREIAAHVSASTGLGKVSVEPRFPKVGKNIYESADYAGAADRLELDVHSGAGNVTVMTK